MGGAVREEKSIIHGTRAFRTVRSTRLHDIFVFLLRVVYGRVNTSLLA